MAKQKGEAWLGYRFTEARESWVSLFFFRFVSLSTERAFFENTSVTGTGIKKETVQTLLETRAIRKPFFSPSLPFLRDSFGAKRNFSIWNLNRCMCRVSLKWWPETEGGKLNWKELEIRFISKNVYLYVAIMLFCRSETCAKFHFCGKNGNWKKVNRERS